MINESSQIFIEGKSNHLYIYVHLKDFKIESAETIFNLYISRFEEKNFRKIKVFFWDKGFPGDYLSMYRKKINRKCTRFLMREASFIEATFDYLYKNKKVSSPVIVN